MIEKIGTGVFLVLCVCIVMATMQPTAEAHPQMQDLSFNDCVAHATELGDVGACYWNFCTCGPTGCSSTDPCQSSCNICTSGCDMWGGCNSACPGC